jgi:hypothetical protein
MIIQILLLFVSCIGLKWELDTLASNYIFENSPETSTTDISNTQTYSIDLYKSLYPSETQMPH